MKAVVIAGVGQLGIASVPDPAPAAGEVIVAVTACGICGTDLHLVDGHVPTTFPLIPGHEFSGEVVALGAGVTRLQLGDRVVADPNQPCGSCRPCRRGRTNLCENYAAVGVNMPGAAAEFVAVPDWSCVVVAPHLDLTDAALVEPLACSVRGFDVLQLAPGDEVLLYGAGTMGLINLALAQQFGAAGVDVVDRNPDRLATAIALGARRAVTSAEELDGPQAWDAVIDCTGVIAAIEDGLGRVGKGGTFLQFGVAPQQATAQWSPFRIYRDEVRIVGSMAILDSFERAAELLAAGAIDPSVIITDRVPLSSYVDALERLRAGQGRKQLVLPGA